MAKQRNDLWDEDGNFLVIHRPILPSASMTAGAPAVPSSAVPLLLPAGSSIKTTNPARQPKKRSKVCIGICVISFLILVVGVVVILAIQSPLTQDPRSDPGKKYCWTSRCREVNEFILNAMNQTVEPCSDFYRYACGGWMKQNPVIKGHTLDNFNIRWAKNLVILKSLLENVYTTNRAENKAQFYYESCMDKEQIEGLGSYPMLNLLRKIGGWNISGPFDIAEWDFQNTLQLLSFLPTANRLFSWTVGVNLKDNSRNIIELDQANLGLVDRDNYFEIHPVMLGLYLHYMTKVGVLLGGKQNSTKEQLLDVIMLEIRLARIMIPDTDKKNLQSIYNKMTISELTELAPAIDWLQYFNFAFKRVNRVILPSDEIIVMVPNFIRKMSYLIQEYLSTPEKKTVLSNYLAWSLVQGSVSRLSEPFQLPKSLVDMEMFAYKDDTETWLSCISQTNDAMELAVSAMFVNKVFHEDTKAKVKQMIDEIREAFLQNLPSLEWLDHDTKALIKEKIDAITVLVGYPDFIMDPLKLDQYYKELMISRNEHFSNGVRAKEFLVLKNLETLDRSSQSDRDIFQSSIVNAYYTPIKNKIVVPAGILQDPFYHPENPKSFSFGRLGFLMGHELIHAIDNHGRLFDKSGNLFSWWKNAISLKEFEEKAQCFVDQYSSYVARGIRLNGNQTLPDNIADNGGLRTAFRAYKNWVSKHGNEPSLPFISLSNEQLFFVSFAQMWCASVDEETMRKMLRKWTHSPHKYRVLGSVSNSEDFAQAFGCSTTRYRTEKCQLW